MNPIEWLKGKKTYIVAFATAIYATGIQCGLWQHYPVIDLLLGSGGMCTMRAGLAKAAAPLLLVCLLPIFAVGCATPAATPGGAPHANAVMQIVKNDIETGKVEGRVKLLVQGAIIGCQFAKVPDYQHEFALVNAWATRVNTLLKGQTTPLTTDQMQAEAASVGITESNTVALQTVSTILSTLENNFVSWGATPADIYSGLLQGSAGAAEGTAQFAGQ